MSAACGFEGGRECGKGKKEGVGTGVTRVNGKEQVVEQSRTKSGTNWWSTTNRSTRRRHASDCWTFVVRSRGASDVGRGMVGLDARLKDDGNDMRGN